MPIHPGRKAGEVNTTSERGNPSRECHNLVLVHLNQLKKSRVFRSEDVRRVESHAMLCNAIIIIVITSAEPVRENSAVNLERTDNDDDKWCNVVKHCKVNFIHGFELRREVSTCKVLCSNEKATSSAPPTHRQRHTERICVWNYFRRRQPIRWFIHVWCNNSKRRK